MKNIPVKITAKIEAAFIFGVPLEDTVVGEGVVVGDGVVVVVVGVVVVVVGIVVVVVGIVVVVVGIVVGIVETTTLSANQIPISS